MKYLALNDDLYRYVCRHRSGSSDPVLESLRLETAALGDDARMQISPEQGSFLTILAAAIGARTALEVGTFTGHSSISIARGLPAEGKLLCLDESREWTDIARRYWSRADVERKIDLRLGPAIATLQALEPGLVLDMAFIDADKREYLTYYELLLPKVRQNGLILFDNMLWGGRVLPGHNAGDTSAPMLDELNRTLAADPRVETVLLPIADGIQLCRKR